MTSIHSWIKCIGKKEDYVEKLINAFSSFLYGHIDVFTDICTRVCNVNVSVLFLAISKAMCTFYHLFHLLLYFMQPPPPLHVISVPTRHFFFLSVSNSHQPLTHLLPLLDFSVKCRLLFFLAGHEYFTIDAKRLK